MDLRVARWMKFGLSVKRVEETGTFQTAELDNLSFLRILINGTRENCW